MINPPPILYSFRRCPYAMRARIAIAKSGNGVELREVVLQKKPQELLEISSKGTVPVLQLSNGSVIEESLDIMQWALSHNDPDNWLNKNILQDTAQLIQQNDESFKYFLDRYKYADRYPEHTQQYYRQQACHFLQNLEDRLRQHSYLCADTCSLADIAIFPFIRQFAQVDIHWFQSSAFSHLNQWLKEFLESPLFLSIMQKYPAWQTESKKQYFPSSNTPIA